VLGEVAVKFFGLAGGNSSFAGAPTEFIGSGGAVGSACDVGACTVGDVVCWAIAIAPLGMIVSASADNIINFIFMYIPQIVKSIC
jgi:hypothetical protein